jgi:peptidoglycan/xylan/chitin deacetylase (PgdA/CDA1 family)
VHVTFDDAYRNIAPTVDELLAQEIPVTIFVCTGFADRGGAPLEIDELAGDDPEQLATMTWDDLRRLGARGARVQSHGVAHAHLTSLTDDALERELAESKQRVEDEVGAECVDFAYPFGEHDGRVRAAVRAAGYRRGFALAAKRGDPYEHPRVDLYRRNGAMETLLKATLPYALRKRLERR